LTEAYLIRANRPALVQQLRVVDVLSTSVVATVLYVSQNLTVTTAVLGLLLPTAVLRSGVAVWAVKRSAGAPGAKSHHLLYPLRRTARRFWPWDAVVAATASIDVIVAALVLSRSDLEIYAVAGAIGRLALAPFSAVAPYVIASASQGSPWRGVWLRWLSSPTVLVIGFLLILSASPAQLVELVYGDKYRHAGEAAVLLTAAFAFQA
jgi:hypothetical protein